MASSRNISVAKDRIAQFCIQHHIRRLSFFGSVLREDFRPDSDIDVLLEFQPDQRVGLLRLSALELELSGIMGRKCDLRTPAELSRYFRQEVVNEAEIQYVES